jgi:polyphosphate kinase
MSSSHFKPHTTPSGPTPITMNSPERFFNRELSWLEFNDRVLQEANNTNHPLFERLRFLAISDKNLDEFYMVRVAGMKGQLRARLDRVSPEGMSTFEQLETIDKRSRILVEEQQATWKRLKKELSHEGLQVVHPHELFPDEGQWLKEHFEHVVLPTLTPVAVDPAHPFPLIPNDGFSIVLKLSKGNKSRVYWALIPIPQNIPRFIRLKDDHFRFIPLEEAIGLHYDKLFPGFQVADSGFFHLIRDSEMEIDEDVEDLVETFKSALQQRRHGNVIRLMVNHDISEDLLDFVVDELEVHRQDIFPIKGLFNLSDLPQLMVHERPDLMFMRYTPRYPERIRHFAGDCFAAIRHKDFIVHHPYESFDAVVAFLRQAAQDPDVLTIKQTLYRTSDNSPIVRALIEAAEAGKSVTAIIELKARFDEEMNIRLAQKMEQAGVQVVYGFIDLKTHSKVSMVVRREGKEMRTYMHYGTGNYHPITAKIYTDLSLFTCDPVLGKDTVKMFNYLTGYARPESLEKLVISPLAMQQKLLQMIHQEAQNAREGKPAQIWAKLNSLVDPVAIDALYQASQAGVQIDLIIRGICCLRPGIKGLSENIRVKSVVGRFLEHSRIICFANGEALPSSAAKLYISSADWMPRNFHKRVETLVPLENPTVRQQVMEQIMLANLKDNQQSWTLDASGHYTRITKSPDPAFSAQDYFMTNPSLSGRGPGVEKKPSPLRLAPPPSYSIQHPAIANSAMDDTTEEKAQQPKQSRQSKNES